MDIFSSKWRRNFGRNTGHSSACCGFFKYLVFFPSVELFEAEGALSLPVVGPSLLPVLAEVGAVGERLAAR